LASYFTHCKINNIHLTLSLFNAMSISYNQENHLISSIFAKRLRKLSPTKNMSEKINFVLKTSEQNAKNKFEIDYDSRNPFRICCLSLTPIYTGADLIECSFCNSPYLPKYDGEVCSICKIGCVGKRVQGIFSNYTKFK